ncbi:unnamed protein product, partial [Mesorhabditis spiculigera]
MGDNDTSNRPNSTTIYEETTTEYWECIEYPTGEYLYTDPVGGRYAGNWLPIQADRNVATDPYVVTALFMVAAALTDTLSSTLHPIFYAPYPAMKASALPPEANFAVHALVLVYATPALHVVCSVLTIGLLRMAHTSQGHRRFHNATKAAVVVAYVSMLLLVNAFIWTSWFEGAVLNDPAERAYR